METALWDGRMLPCLPTSSSAGQPLCNVCTRSGGIPPPVLFCPVATGRSPLIRKSFCRGSLAKGREGEHSNHVVFARGGVALEMLDLTAHYRCAGQHGPEEWLPAAWSRGYIYIEAIR
ncbi:protein of unknown function [Methanoculleus bourgensis]|uniref:Uncharacterized protein n=1 Tax=Methanoculleus bourgensis TaxID=83986 RepID=A0A0X3BPQ7_9EURY|nr:protein of unknown function [Methanoculleus bourgensis]